MGGRVVPTSHGPAILFMYDNDHGTRLVLLTRRMEVDQIASMTRRSHGDVGGFTWADDDIGYSLVGALLARAASRKPSRSPPAARAECGQAAAARSVTNSRRLIELPILPRFTGELKAITFWGRRLLCITAKLTADWRLRVIFDRDEASRRNCPTPRGQPSGNYWPPWYLKPKRHLAPARPQSFADRSSWLASPRCE